MNPYQIVLADDHPIYREGIKSIIEGIPDLKVVGEASDGLELLELLRKVSPQLAIVDISMPNLGGIEAIKEIKSHYPQLKVLILSMHKSKEHLSRALSLQVEGYLIKEDALTDLVSAIETVRQGGTHISSRLADQLTEIFAKKCRRKPAGSLTEREIQVLKLLAEGKTSKEIASLLSIEIKTVQAHRFNIKRKLNIKKNSELIKYAIQQGYTPLNCL